MKKQLCFLIFFLLISIIGCSSQNDMEVYEDPVVIEGSIIPITEENIDEIINENEMILVHFTSYDKSCNYCVESNKFIDEIAKKYRGNLKIGRITWNPWISIQNSKEMRKKYKIQGLPIFIFMKDNRVLWRHDGFGNEDIRQIQTKINKVLQRS